MSSLRRILSSRANGRLSRGPLTQEGKQRASRNGVRHGLLSRCLVLDIESSDAFDDLLSQLVERLQPADGMELGFIEEMAASYWRMRRAWAMETRSLQKRLAAQPDGDPLDRLTDALAALPESSSPDLISRYETRLHRIYQRALHNLLLMRALELPDEPSPISEHHPPPDEN